MENATRTAAAVALSLDAVAAQVVSAFIDAGLPSLLLKGPGLAAWLYGVNEVRPYGDVDLFVPPADQDRAREVLHRLGFAHRHAGVRAGEHSTHAQEWVRTEDGAEVDLHITLALLDANPQRVWEALAVDQDTISLAGAQVAIPGVSGRAFIVALQAIQRGATDARFHEDLSRALRVESIGTWEAATVLAAELGAADVLAAGLRLLPEGAALADRLGLPVARSVGLRLLAEEISGDERLAALRWARLRSAPGLSGKARLLLQELMPSRASLHGPEDARESGSSPALAVSYVRRLAGVLRTAPAGYRHWRRAVRAVGGSQPKGTDAEVAFWALLARALLKLMGLNRTLRLLDLLPPQRAPRPDVVPVETLLPHTTCLHRSLGRSQYMRRRGQQHDVVLGVTGSSETFEAHAWVVPPDSDPADFAVIRRIPR